GALREGQEDVRDPGRGHDGGLRSRAVRLRVDQEPARADRLQDWQRRDRASAHQGQGCARDGPRGHAGGVAGGGQGPEVSVMADSDALVRYVETLRATGMPERQVERRYLYAKRSGLDALPVDTEFGEPTCDDSDCVHPDHQTLKRNDG